MASTFAELFSDFQDQVKIYTEKLDITETSFMRMLTQGMQKFQQETRLIRLTVDIPKDATYDVFYCPNDMYEPIEMKDSDGKTMVMQSYKQLTRNAEKWANGFLETPTDYSQRLVPLLSRGYLYYSGYSMNERLIASQDEFSRLWTIYNRIIYIYPDKSDTSLTLSYVVDLNPISRNSPQWEEWFDTPDAFQALFQTTSITWSLSFYEEAFVNYAIAKYIKSRGNANYKVFEQNYKDEVTRALTNEYTMFQEGVTSYNYAPWS